MFGDHYQQAREAFSAQFETSEKGTVYRRGGRGAPIPVSAEERDTFTEDFVRAMRRLTWAMVAAVLVSAAALFTHIDQFAADDTPSEFALYAITGILLLSFMIFWFRAWYAPSRLLMRRTPVGAALSPDEVLAKTFESVTWTKLAGVLLAAVAFGWMWNQEDRGQIGHLIGIGLPAVLAATAIVQAIRKLAHERKRS